LINDFIIFVLGLLGKIVVLTISVCSNVAKRSNCSLVTLTNRVKHVWIVWAYIKTPWYCFSIFWHCAWL